VREILHFVYHHIVDFRALVGSEADVVKDVVDGIHEVIASSFDLPPLILAERLINVQLLLFRQESVRSRFNVGMLCQELGWILVGSG
jgi:hypothetical protein